RGCSELPGRRGITMENTSLLTALPIHELTFFINKAVIGGLIIGSIYALGAIGVTLIFGILRFAHFAHGDMMTAGALIALVLTWLAPDAGALVGLPTAFVLMPIAMIATAVLAIFLDRWVYKPLRTANVRPVVIVMASVGVMLMMQGAIRLFVGTDARQLYVGAKDIYRLPVADSFIIITEPQLLLFIVTVICVV